MPDDEWDSYDEEFDYTGGPEEPDEWRGYMDEP